MRIWPPCRYVCDQAFKDYNRAATRFDSWNQARPRLAVGQSHYAASLVWEMIRALEKIIEKDPYHTWYIPEAQECLKMLYELLGEDPPPLPPATDALLPRGFSFCVIPAIL